MGICVTENWRTVENLAWTGRAHLYNRETISRLRNSDWDWILQNKKKQDEHISQLEATILELETIVEAEDNSPLVTVGNGALSERNGIYVNLNKKYSKRVIFNF